MADWTQCPNCNLKHALRPDGLCPRCRHPVAGWGSAAPAPAPAAPAEGWGSTVPPAAPAVAPPGAPAAAAAYPPAATYGVPGGYRAAQGATPATAFTVGGFLSASFSTWVHNARWVIPVALVAYLPLAFVFVPLSRLAETGSAADIEESVALGLATSLVVAGLLSVFLMPVEMGAVVRAGVRQLRREPVGLGDMLGAALRSFFPLLGLMLLVGLATMATACTVVVPFILLSGWAASLPAVITERLGPIEAMKRSWDLTRGLRWQVFGGFFVLYLILMALQMVQQQVILGIAVAGSGDRLGATAVAAGIGIVLQAVEATLLTTGTAVAYHQLRVAAEGPEVATLGQVFE